MNKARHVSRRGALKLGAAAAALPFGAHPHGRRGWQGFHRLLGLGFPAGNEVMRKQVVAWAEKNKVDVRDRFHCQLRQQSPPG